MRLLPLLIVPSHAAEAAADPSQHKLISRQHDVSTGAFERRTSAPLQLPAQTAGAHRAARGSSLTRSASTSSSTAALPAGVSAQHAQHAQHGAGGSSGAGGRRSPFDGGAPSRSRSLSPRGRAPPGRSRLGRTTDESRTTADSVGERTSVDYVGSRDGGGRRQLSDSQTALSPARSEFSASSETLCLTLAHAYSLTRYRRAQQSIASSRYIICKTLHRVFRTPHILSVS